MTKKKLNINHPCVYPTDMIERIIKMSSNERDWVLDPFVGSGSTLVAAKKLKRNSIGIDINQDYDSLVKKRLNNELGLNNY
jgi:DNA modification methylase